MKISCWNIGFDNGVSNILPLFNSSQYFSSLFLKMEKNGEKKEQTI